MNTNSRKSRAVASPWPKDGKEEHELIKETQKRRPTKMEKTQDSVWAARWK